VRAASYQEGEAGQQAWVHATIILRDARGLHCSLRECAIIVYYHCLQARGKDLDLQLKMLGILSKVNHISYGGLEGCCHSADREDCAILVCKSQYGLADK
jgi:hypothetical protein